MKASCLSAFICVHRRPIIFFHSFLGGDRRGSDRGDGGTIMQNTYLQWVIENTATIWWHDSAEAAELDLGLARGAVGVTTNPYLANLALHKDRLLWAPAIQEVFAQKLPPEAKAEALTRIAVTRTAEKLLAEYHASKGQRGLVCAQVNPLRAGDRESMLAMANRFHGWAPNIAVKLPATSAGPDAPR